MTEIKATLRSSPTSVRSLVNQALVLVRTAKQEANHIRDEARREASLRIKKAYQRGRKRAYREAQHVLRKRLALLETEFAAISQQYKSQLKEQSVSLGIQLAEQLLQSELTINTQSVQQRLENLSRSLTEESPQCLRCHPEMQAVIAKVSTIPIHTDDSIPFGDIAIETNAGTVQTDMQQHFKSLQQYTLDEAQKDCEVEDK